MPLRTVRTHALVFPAAALALALAGCTTEEGPKAPAKAVWTPAVKVETMPAKAELPPGESRTYVVGESWVWKTMDGTEDVREVVAVDGSEVSVQVSWGCSYTHDASGFAPVTEFSNCSGGGSGTQQVERSGSIFPLAVGNTESWKYSGRSDKGNEWTGERSCEVAGTANVTVPAGSFDTYHVICMEKRARLDFYYSPEVRNSVIFSRAPAGGATKGRRYHYELVRFEPAA